MLLASAGFHTASLIEWTSAGLCLVSVFDLNWRQFLDLGLATLLGMTKK